MSKTATGFLPVIDADVETLILGSFPSVASLGKAQYYGHAQNHFWRLVGAVIAEPLYEMEYAQRLKMLLQHRIGLWDIIDKCKREGSLDSDIRDPAHNDFQRVTGVAGKLRRVCFNGKTAPKWNRGLSNGVLKPWCCRRRVPRTRFVSRKSSSSGGRSYRRIDRP